MKKSRLNEVIDSQTEGQIVARLNRLELRVGAVERAYNRIKEAFESLLEILKTK